MEFAIIGCGTIAQIMHIPNVLEVPDAELAALCDPAANVTDELGDRYNVAPERRYSDPERLIDESADDLDAVIVTTPMQTHADVVERTLTAGLHTLVEKPLAVTPADADRLADVAAQSDATAMVAYNRRFELAYERLADELADVEHIDSVTAYAVDADFSKSLPEIYDLVEPELDAAFIERSTDRRREQCKQAIGTDDDELAAAYDFQLEHVCHDINALRGLFGDVVAVDHVDFVRDGYFGIAHLVFESGERCLLQTGDSERHWHEQFVRIDAPDRTLRLEFDHPFVKYNSATLSVRQGAEETVDCQYSPTREESFKRELERFMACVRGEREVPTPVSEARDDVELIASLFTQSLE
ncbi:Gfo/Idh/MocA family oxidoreductase [Haloterrigena sp. SYSU A121-1]|uniref:Gfo/Idh/MocA family oxidoreductase n=1 Tax=Haloterrigena gelatinilytica TaxID=2741724 RepID=A0A8J8GUG2_9EURY|nr:Gfo/Idh/MocA family oxidoreductase [Haloterrigena gelatinilytica]NUB93680.1 Gfo/Idh/MocA family oxidoreductase [Haloterrigena gelatinilytica]